MQFLFCFYFVIYGQHCFFFVVGCFILIERIYSVTNLIHLREHTVRDSEFFVLNTLRNQKLVHDLDSVLVSVSVPISASLPFFDLFLDSDSVPVSACFSFRVLIPGLSAPGIFFQVGPQDVCGCPLEADFPFKSSEAKRYCQNLKKSCLKHYSWEKLRRAEIDQEKLNLVSSQLEQLLSMNLHE